MLRPSTWANGEVHSRLLGERLSGTSSGRFEATGLVCVGEGMAESLLTMGPSTQGFFPPYHRLDHTLSWVEEISTSPGTERISLGIRSCFLSSFLGHPASLQPP